MSSSRVTYTREDFLRLRKHYPIKRETKRKLWYFGLLTTEQSRRNADIPSNNQDVWVASPRPRAPNVPRNKGYKNSIQTTLKIATFNARTLLASWRLHELIELSVEQSVSVVAVQEHRRTTAADINIVSDRRWMFKGAPADHGVGGIGFLLSPAAADAMLDVRFITNNIGLLSIALSQQKRRLHIFSVHAPTAPNTLLNPQETEDFYDCLNTEILNLPRRDHLLLCGDFNAPLSVDHIRVKNNCGVENANSQYLSSLVASNDLIPVNAFLRQKANKLVTFRGPNKRKTRLDWIFTPNKNSVLKMNNIQPSVINSDHTFLIAEMNLRWTRTMKKLPAFPLWSALEENERRQNFVCKYLETRRVSNTDLNLTESVNIAANHALPIQRPNKPSSLLTDDCEISRSRSLVQSACDRYGFESLEARAAREHLEYVMKSKMELYAEHCIKEIQQHTVNCRHSAAWRVINRLTGRKMRVNSIISAASIEERKLSIRNHYQFILNVDSSSNAELIPLEQELVIRGDEFNLTPISVSEFKAATRTMRADATPGPDGIPNRVLQLDELHEDLTSILNGSSVLGGAENEILHTEWRHSSIISIPKKGSSSSLDNQRGIAMMCTMAKTLNKIILNHIFPIVNPHLLHVQSGFRPGRSTTEQIVSLRSIVDTCKTHKSSVSIIYVDFKKAFDSICRDQMFVILKMYNVPDILCNAINQLYTNTTATVITSHGPTMTFKTTSGVLQGDTLSPFLFVVVMDYILRNSLSDEDGYELSRRQGSRQPRVQLSALAYADDVALLCNSPETAQRVLNRMHEVANPLGMHINASKTKVMYIGTEQTPVLHLPTGERVEVVNDFKYLGVKVLNPKHLVKERVDLAWTAANQLRTIFDSNIPDNTKIKLFQSVVESVLMYGLEAIPLTKT